MPHFANVQRLWKLCPFVLINFVKENVVWLQGHWSFSAYLIQLYQSEQCLRNYPRVWGLGCPGVWGKPCPIYKGIVPIITHFCVLLRYYILLGGYDTPSPEWGFSCFTEENLVWEPYLWLLSNPSSRIWVAMLLLENLSYQAPAGWVGTNPACAGWVGHPTMCIKKKLALKRLKIHH